MARRYVTFMVAGGRYALPVASVARILRAEGIGAVPAAPPFVDGAVTHGGEVVAVINMGARLGLARTVPDRPSRLIIIEQEGKSYALLVDRVREVIEAPQEEPPAEVGLTAGVLAEFAAGIAGSDQEAPVILDLLRILSPPAKDTERRAAEHQG